MRGKVCVCERDCLREIVCVCECECVCENVCACVCVCVSVCVNSLTAYIWMVEWTKSFRFTLHPFIKTKNVLQG